jgi:hypothetical protein
MEVQQKTTNLLWDYIPLPFRCEYEFNGINDLYHAECKTDNLTYDMVLDIFNNMTHKDYIKIDDNVTKVWISGEYLDNKIIIQYGFESFFDI